MFADEIKFFQLGTDAMAKYQEIEGYIFEGKRKNNNNRSLLATDFATRNKLLQSNQLTNIKYSITNFPISTYNDTINLETV